MASISDTNADPTIVTIKWGKEKYENVEVQPIEGIDMFKAQIFALTSVPVERQKILAKGKQLKEDTDLLKLRNGDILMLMGSSEVLRDGPSQPIVFEEDMTDSQKAGLQNVLPPGLVNLGNTCYMNSGLQCLKSIPELRAALNQFTSTRSASNDADHVLTARMGNLFNEMDRTTSENPVTPLAFTAQFRQVFPQFAERNNKGQYMQQDADECFSQLMQTLLTTLRGTEVPVESTPIRAKVEDVFQGTFETTTKCLASDTVPPTSVSEPFRKLKCFIKIDTNHLTEGIKASLSEEIEKNSPELGGPARFLVESRISKLPLVLNIQYVRFFWRRDTGKKAKILRKVVYPLTLDLMEFCTPELKAQLSERREAQIKEEEAKLGIRKKNDGEQAAPAADVEMDEKKQPVVEGKPSGRYELVGLVTHKGRMADSGHYIGWVRRAPGDWVKYDDDVVSTVSEDEIKNLAGGGDWHMVYLAFYRHILE
eukprot:TRINITY_DN667_c0_g2_i2.p1 TRINITY_DN667_c0_g2~~TRINITY_DN667_c0_g2_i2.p1  ORF type:complete len:481 (-),score=190.35 TRINITY_DN667_c0_g2_i2:230-1672(-)